MEKTLTVQVRELEEMTGGELAEKYEEIFGEEPRSRNRQYLFKRVAYGLQEKAQGGLSERAHRRRKQITDETRIISTATSNPNWRMVELRFVGSTRAMVR